MPHALCRAWAQAGFSRNHTHTEQALAVKQELELVASWGGAHGLDLTDIQRFFAEVCMRMPARASIHACVLACMCVRMHVSTPACMYVYVYVYVCMHPSPPKPTQAQAHPSSPNPTQAHPAPPKLTQAHLYAI